MICGIVKTIVQRLFAPEVQVVNHDTPILRALIAENAALRRRLRLPLKSSVQVVDGQMSRITYDLPAQLWASRTN